jgi:hypothetical protein
MKLGLILLAASFLTIALAGCGGPPNERQDLDQVLSDRVYALSDGQTLDIAETATFEWDQMDVFETCLDQDVIDRTLGFPFDTTAMRNGRYCYDSEVGRPLVVFLSGTQVTGWVILNEDKLHAMFFDTNTEGVLVVPRSRATFIVSVDGVDNSERDLSLAP